MSLLAFLARPGPFIGLDTDRVRLVRMDKRSRHDVKVASNASLGNWRRRLTEEEIALVRAETSDVADAFYDVNIGSVEYILGGPVSSSIVPYTKTAEGVVLEFVDSIGMHVLPSGFHIEASGE